LDELQAAFLSVKLPHLDSITARRNEIANEYLTNINNPHIVLPHTPSNVYHAYHLFVLKCRDGNSRTKFQNYLLANGIETMVHYPSPIYKQEVYKEFNHLSLPISEMLSKTIISIPLF
jgi:dTDP-4-amino-4,6-dideoxygalactose transaminase